ncbi:hypothetical protein L1987_86915 [Smallanthus sonchifolius]|uniref:Uncharacterized protein n=1 Tax=Smallanthus sonchifolius TaxID=185202 RepID=A0ACB8Y186_9ASTR|nr:hypothetical protein L1987_86915 [Smallanthus sonchifolius]
MWLMVLRLVLTLVEIMFKFLLVDSTLTAEGFSRYGEVLLGRFESSGQVKSGRVGSEHLVSSGYRMVESLVFVLQRCKRWVCWFQLRRGWPRFLFSESVVKLFGCYHKQLEVVMSF